MSRGKTLTLLLTAFLFVLACAPAGYGCSCGRTQTVLDAYESADVVVVARAVSQERKTKEETKEEGQPGGVAASEDLNDWRHVLSTKMLVERVYKGGVKAGEEMVFAQGGGADCIYTFDKEDVGRAYLFYLKRIKGSDFWIAGTCGRSRPVEGARDDLLYLNNLAKARGRTRISGTFECFTADAPDLAGLRVVVRGGGKTFETRTDEHGVYEIYDAPPGKYTPKTDAKGHFSLKVLKGQKGSFYGRMYAYVGEFENCPRLDQLIRKTGRDNAELKTPAVEVQADNNLYGVELRFPFPGCRKAKIE